jgi:hypothetical protein
MDELNATVESVALCTIAPVGPCEADVDGLGFGVESSAVAGCFPLATFNQRFAVS